MQVFLLEPWLFQLTVEWWTGNRRIMRSKYGKERSGKSPSTFSTWDFSLQKKVNSAELVIHTMRKPFPTVHLKKLRGDSTVIFASLTNTGMLSVQSLQEQQVTLFPHQRGLGSKLGYEVTEWCQPCRKPEGTWNKSWFSKSHTCTFLMDPHFLCDVVTLRRLQLKFLHIHLLCEKIHPKGSKTVG